MITKRVLSWTVDVTVLVVVVVVVSLVGDALGVVALVVGVPAYQILVEHDYGGTLGHRLARLKVIEAESSDAAGRFTLALRAIVIGAMIVPLAIPLIVSVVLAIRRGDGIALHDLLTRSRVTTR